MTTQASVGVAAGLRGLALRPRYSSGRDDLAADFFAPCVSRSDKYDRAVGFFSSSLYLLVGVPIADFARRGGAMRLVCCPRVSPRDIEAMALGYESRAHEAAIERELDEVLQDPAGRAASTLLASLIAHGTLDIQIAFRPRQQGIFHDKVGVFEDAAGDRVSFGGSANESWSAWSTSANHESFHAFTSWADPARVDLDSTYFESVWAGNEPDLEIKPFPQVAHDRLEAVAREDLEDVERELAELVADDRTAGSRPSLRRHQLETLADWRRHEHRGIAEHATGSGKTITALTAVAEALDDAKTVLILVPSVLLQGQWEREVRSFFGPDAPQILLAGGGFSEWREGATLRNFCAVGGSRRAVIAVMDTAASEAFVERVADLPNLFLVADEVHRLGSQERQRTFLIDAAWRLGLSATWRREGDPQGTDAILQYFERVLEPVYTLADAVREGWLCPYTYTMHTIGLDPDEQEEWKGLSRAIAQALSPGDTVLSERARLLLLRRARIVKKARAKPELAAGVLASDYRDGDAWLVYCDDSDQLGETRAAIEAGDLHCFEYHTQMSGDGPAALAEFERSGGIMLAIRCLDEGVDIPRISHALILASSTTRREFIQRRGRILRRADRKFRAHVHDVIVDARGFDDPATAGFARSELERALEFCGSASDSLATQLQIERMLRDLPDRSIALRPGEGTEDEDD